MLHRVLHAFASDCARCVRCGFVMTRFSGTTAATAGATAWMCPPLSGTSRLPFSFPAASAAPPPARALPPARVAVVTSQLGRKPACNPVVSCPRPSSSGTTRCRTTWAEPTPAKTAAGATSSCLPASAFTVSRKGRSFQFFLLTALRAGPPFSWGVTSGGPPSGRSLSKDGTRADSAKDFCRLFGGVTRRKSD